MGRKEEAEAPGASTGLGEVVTGDRAQLEGWAGGRGAEGGDRDQAQAQAKIRRRRGARLGGARMGEGRRGGQQACGML